MNFLGSAPVGADPFALCRVGHYSSEETGVRLQRCCLAFMRELADLAFGGGDGSYQAFIGAFVGETLPGAGAQREIDSVGVNQGRHAFAGNPAGKSGFHFAK
jgi:hypothetical protein